MCIYVSVSCYFSFVLSAKNLFEYFLRDDLLVVNSFFFVLRKRNKGKEIFVLSLTPVFAEYGIFFFSASNMPS